MGGVGVLEDGVLLGTGEGHLLIIEPQSRRIHRENIGLIGHLDHALSRRDGAVACDQLVGRDGARRIDIALVVQHGFLVAER